MTGDKDKIVSLNFVYRIVWTDPPTLWDFESNAERGIPVRQGTPPELLRLYDGISVFRESKHARRTARTRPPWLGKGYIARVSLTGDADFRIERTLKGKGHYTLWMDPATALSRVDHVELVTPREGADDGI